MRGHRPLIRRPIILRYSEPYGPNVASDVWRGKTHKAMAARAKRAWTRLKKRQTPVWLAHLSSKNFNAFASGASALANAGQRLLASEAATGCLDGIDLAEAPPERISSPCAIAASTTTTKLQ